MATQSKRKHVYDNITLDWWLFLGGKKMTWRTSLESPHQSTLSTSWHGVTLKTTGRENKWAIKAILRARDISVNATTGLPVPRKVETEQMSRQCAIWIFYSDQISTYKNRKVGWKCVFGHLTKHRDAKVFELRCCNLLFSSIFGKVEIARCLKKYMCTASANTWWIVCLVFIFIFYLFIFFTKIKFWDMG